MIHADFIEILVKIFQPKSYLELGVQEGITFKVIERLVPKADAVDILKRFNTNKGIFFQGTTAEFFNQNVNIYDMIFIDANHDYDFVKYDFKHSLEILSNKGVLILHDTDPEEKWLLAADRCSDSYRIVNEIDTDKYFTFTFPLTEAGLTIITLKSNRRCLEFV